MSAVWNGSRFEIPCLVTRSWLDTSDPKHPPRTPNCYTNKRGAIGKYDPSLVQPVSGMTWHTVHGKATGEITPRDDVKCVGENGALANAKYFAKSASEAASHFIIADNGVTLQIADLVTDRTWHAGAWNPFTVGIELDQSSDEAICSDALISAVNLAWWLSRQFGVQPMIPWKGNGPDLGDIERLQGNNAKSFYGHFFHAGQPVRGRGDPGPALGYALRDSGFETFDLAKKEDIATWQARQAILQMPAHEQDGIPGPATVAAMQKQLGRSTWVVRNNAPQCESAASGEWTLAELAIASVVTVAAGYGLYRLAKRPRRRT